MEQLIGAISSVGFPIVMCGVLCYYIFKIQTKLIESIQENTKVLSKIAINIEEIEKEEERHEQE